MRILQVRELPRGARFGNILHFVALAKKYAELCDAVFECCPWQGRSLFTLECASISRPPTMQLGWPWPQSFNGVAELYFSEAISYPTNYTEDDFRRYFQFRPEMLAPAEFDCEVVCHWRVGDFVTGRNNSGDYVWPVIDSEFVFRRSVEGHGLSWEKTTIIREDIPHHWSGHDGLAFATDFQMLCRAKHLFMYPLSSFSGNAGMLNPNAIYAPEGFRPGPTECLWRRVSRGL